MSDDELPKDLEVEMWVRRQPRFGHATTSMRGVPHNLITLKGAGPKDLTVFVLRDTPEEAWHAAMLLLMKDRLKG